jgi:uncharacterized membrane protein
VTEEREAGAVPRWLPVTCLILSILAMAVSVYLTYEHFASSGGTGLVCPIGGKSCTTVTTSPQSKFLGVPVALLGLLYSLGMAVLNLPALWRSRSPALGWIRLAAAAAGMVFVLWLIYAELFIIGAICMWCTVVHVLTFMLFCLVLWGTVGLAPEVDEDD